MATSSKAKSSSNKVVGVLNQHGRAVKVREFSLIPIPKNELESILKVEVFASNSSFKKARVFYKDNSVEPTDLLLDFDTNAEVGDILRKSSLELRQYSNMNTAVLYGKLV